MAQREYTRHHHLATGSRVSCAKQIQVLKSLKQHLPILVDIRLLPAQLGMSCFMLYHLVARHYWQWLTEKASEDKEKKGLINLHRDHHAR